MGLQTEFQLSVSLSSRLLFMLSVLDYFDLLIPLNQKSCAFQERGSNVEAGILLPSVLILSDKATIFCDQIWSTESVSLKRKETEKRLIVKDVWKMFQVFHSWCHFCKISSNFSSTFHEFSFPLPFLVCPMDI